MTEMLVMRKEGHRVEFWPEEDHERSVLITHVRCSCGFEDKAEVRVPSDFIALEAALWQAEHETMVDRLAARVETHTHPGAPL